MSRQFANSPRPMEVPAGCSGPGRK